MPVNPVIVELLNRYAVVRAPAGKLPMPSAGVDDPVDVTAALTLTTRAVSIFEGGCCAAAL